MYGGQSRPRRSLDSTTSRSSNETDVGQIGIRSRSWTDLAKAYPVGDPRHGDISRCGSHPINFLGIPSDRVGKILLHVSTLIYHF